MLFTLPDTYTDFLELEKEVGGHGMQVGYSIFASQVQFFLREAACRADSPLYSTLAIPLLVLWPPSHHDAEDISAKRFVYKCQLRSSGLSQLLFFC